ncbi:hypothetical protein LINPERHAP1_LOCUS2128, partial [Linum perenne]
LDRLSPIPIRRHNRGLNLQDATQTAEGSLERLSSSIFKIGLLASPEIFDET